jgi:hypothetical protein
LSEERRLGARRIWRASTARRQPISFNRLPQIIARQLEDSLPLEGLVEVEFWRRSQRQTRARRSRPHDRVRPDGQVQDLCLKRPHHRSLARLIASRRSVLIRCPGLRGISDGATTLQSCPAASRQLRRQRFQGHRHVRDLLPYFRTSFLVAACLRKRDCGRVLINVEADICDSLIQDPFPMHEARRRNARRNPR